MASLIGLPMYRFRFRGRLELLGRIVACFRDNPGVGLHPGQIARETGLATATVIERLQATPELFVKLPKRDDLTRYRLTSTVSVRSPEEIDAMLARLARTESLTLYAIVAIVAAIGVLALVTAFPLAKMVAG
jgi:hypothetical protein